MEKVTIKSKQNYVFGNWFYAGQKTHCIAKFKLDKTCDSAIIQCDVFETKCRQDKLFFKVHRQPKKIMCGTEKPYMEVDKKDKKFVMKFIKRNRKTDASMVCNVMCSDAMPGMSTESWDLTTDLTPKPETTTTQEEEEEVNKDCKCSLVNSKRRIVGGIETEINEYPWQVLVLNDGALCGGSII